MGHHLHHCGWCCQCPMWCSSGLLRSPRGILFILCAAMRAAMPANMHHSSLPANLHCTMCPDLCPNLCGGTSSNLPDLHSSSSNVPDLHSSSSNVPDLHSSSS